MEKIGLFFGSDTGCTEIVAKMIKERLIGYEVDVFDVYDIEGPEILDYNKLVFGLSTWHDGQLQSSWDDFYNSFSKLDLTGKTVALFGLGDQYGYSTYFCDGIGIIGKLAEENGAKIIGHWSTEGYEHDESKAQLDDNTFIGLCLDDDNQDELTEERVDQWVKQIVEEF
ncbi:MAG: flavodoxin [Crocinitomicaceae bacterium]|nr:flavodoxin [Crocinitomicaceae bacterium]|tara:strand:- start:12017 stop:12523 length:507 start_codon:yes stop_codon:yes gene_type:complete